MKVYPRKMFAVLALILTPALSQAQNRPQQGGAGGGMNAQVGPLVQVIKQLDLTDDQQASAKEIMQQAQSDIRDAVTGIQNATPEERQQKMQDMQKIAADARTKVEALLTPEQKTKYYPLMAKTIVTQAQQRLKMIKNAAVKQDLTDDEKSQMEKLATDDQKTLDGLASDADGVKDADGLADVQKKVEALQQDARKQIVGILGPDGAQQLMQSMRANAGGRARQGGEGAAANDGPTTKPGNN